MDHAPRKFDSREVVGPGDFDVGVLLVVFERDVVMRFVALDQRIFQPQRVQFAFFVGGVFAGDDEFDIGDFPAQAARFGVGNALVKVTAHAVPQAFGLTDVYHYPVGVFHQVNARPGRQVIEDALDVVGCFHERQESGFCLMEVILTRAG